MQEVKHPSCDGVAFYTLGFPVRRGFIPEDAMNKEGTAPIAMGRRVECVSCGEKIDFSEVNNYYDMVEA